MTAIRASWACSASSTCGAKACPASLEKTCAWRVGRARPNPKAMCLRQFLFYCVSLPPVESPLCLPSVHLDVLDVEWAAVVELASLCVFLPFPFLYLLVAFLLFSSFSCSWLCLAKSPQGFFKVADGLEHCLVCASSRVAEAWKSRMSENEWSKREALRRPKLCGRLCSSMLLIPGWITGALLCLLW